MTLPKHILLCIICLASHGMLSAQDWVKKASLPDTAYARHHPVTFSIDGYGYLLGGSASQSPYLSDFYRYDPVLEEWSQLPAFPGPPRSYSYAIVYGGKAYMGFGFGLTSVMSDLWEYDPGTGIWTEKTACPGDGRGHPAFLEANGKIYVGLGGGDMGNLNDFWQYDIATDQWAQISDFPAYRRHHPFYFSVGGMVYAGFGHGSESVNGSTIYNDLYRFDPQNNAWEQMKDFPGEQRVAGTQFSHNGKGYVLSGEGKDHYYLEEGEFWEYDPGADVWTQLPSMPGSGRWAPGSFIIGNTIYATCGTALIDSSGTDENQSDLWAYQFQGSSGTGNLANSPIEIYPNPVQERLFIQSGGIEKGNFKLLSADGRVLRSGLYAQVDGIPVGELPTGIYLIMLETDTVRYQTSFVKL